MLNDLPCISDTSIGIHLFPPSKIPIRPGIKHLLLYLSAGTGGF